MIFLFLVPCLAPVFGQKLRAQSPDAPLEGTIVALGDSLTEGYGVAPGDAYPAQLERKLNSQGRSWRVINAGVSGETSSGTLQRIDWILRLNPDIVILATGANDGLRGLPPAALKDNLDRIITRLKAEKIIVVLVGMKMARNLGEAYISAFETAYREVAATHGAIFMPFMLEGVAMDPQLNQADGIHPTPRGYAVLATHLLPYLERALAIHHRKSP